MADNVAHAEMSTGLMAAQPQRLVWQVAEVVQIFPKTPRVKSLVLEVTEWQGHVAGQHIDLRLTAPDGYQAQRSYSIASAPEEARVMLTVERIEDGEVSPYLTEVLMPGDKLELRDPIGGHFTWKAAQGGPLMLIAGGSGVVPLMAMIRHRAAVGSQVPARLLYSSRGFEEIIYREELERLAAQGDGLEVVHTLTRSQLAGWSGYAQRIDRALLEAVVYPREAKPLIYICGPTLLVEAAASLCVALGREPARIKTERFGPTGG